MSDKKTKVTVQILGEAYSLKGDLDAERIATVAAILDGRMRKIAAGNPSLTPAKVAVLAALNLADEYLRLEEDYRQMVKMVQDVKR